MQTPTELNGLTILRCWRSASSIFCARSCQSTSVAEHAKTAIDVLPARLIDGLGVAGGIMPAIGFAVLLKIMMKNVYILNFYSWFVAAAWLKLPVLAIAAAALAMALIDLMRKSPEPTAPAAQKEEFEDGI